MSFAPETGGTLLKDDGAICLRDYKKGDETKEGRRDQRDPGGPPPTKIRICDKATTVSVSFCFLSHVPRQRFWQGYQASDLHDWPKSWTDEGGAGKHGDGSPPLDWVPDVHHCTTNDCKRRASEETDQESAYHNRMEVLSDGHRDLENGKGGVSKEQGDPTPIKFRHGRPDLRTSSETKDNQTGSERHDFG